jgi:hypothetical protein
VIDAPAEGPLRRGTLLFALVFVAFVALFALFIVAFFALFVVAFFTVFVVAFFAPDPAITVLDAASTVLFAVACVDTGIVPIGTDIIDVVICTGGEVLFGPLFERQVITDRIDGVYVTPK